MKAKDVIRELNIFAKFATAKTTSNFFKTGKGEYSEGDIFIGVSVPEQRRIAKRYIDIDLIELLKLLKSKVHEHRLTGLEILVMKYEEAESAEKKKLVNFYLKNLASVNNWDLVDASASYILGDFLISNDRKILYKLVKSKNLWERRVAIVSTWALIRNGEFKDTIELSKILLSDKHDLIHKATGWMLREMGKKSEKTLINFLDKYAKKMSRTALRYSLERLDKNLKKFYMAK